MIFEDATTGYILNSYGIYPKTVDLTTWGFKWDGIAPPLVQTKLTGNVPPIR